MMKSLLRTAIFSALLALGRKAWEVYQERQAPPPPTPTRRERLRNTVRRR